MRVMTLFLSGGKSLAFWRDEGIFSREILAFAELLRTDAFDRIQIFSYDARDRALLQELGDQDPIYRRFDLIAPPRGQSGKVWGISGVLRNRAAFARSTILRSNQVRGTAPAVLAAWLTGRPLVFRMGYLLSRRLTLNGQHATALAARLLERAAAKTATRIIVTSENVAAHFRADPAIADKVRLLPTYVDTGAFAPESGVEREAAPIAVGRFTAQKNLHALLKGCALAGVGLTLVGKGEQDAELRALAATLPVKVDFAGTVDNAALPALLAQHGMFLLPSLHEGLPKVLIEAMAAGLICIGSDIPGITDLIEDGVTGYLIRGFEPADIAAAIERARSENDPAIGHRARTKIEAHFGLTGYVARETAIYREIA